MGQLPNAVKFYGLQDQENHSTNGKNQELSNWPTARAGAGDNSRPNGKGGKCLGEEARKNWGTPRVSMAQDKQTDSGKSRLGEQAQRLSNWISPNLRDTRRGCNQKQLATEVDKNWPTPATGDPEGGSQACRVTWSGSGAHLTKKNKPDMKYGAKLRDATENLYLHRGIKEGTVSQPIMKLNPRWVEQLMGLPVGWVKPCEEYSNRTDELRMLGNGVVPVQCTRAVFLLIEDLK